MDKKAKKKSRKGNLLIVVSVVLLAALAGAAYYILSEKGIFRIEGASYQYCIGIRYDYPKEAKLVKMKEGTAVSYGENEVMSDTFVVHYLEGEKILLPEDMLMMIPTLGLRTYRVGYFTTFTYEDDLLLAKKEGKSALADRAFLFDGSNTYVFLEPMKLMLKDRNIDLGRFSEVLAVQNNVIEIYNTLTGEYELVETGIGDMLARSESGYTINLGTDTVLCGDKQYMLAVQPELLPDLFYSK